MFGRPEIRYGYPLIKLIQNNNDFSSVGTSFENDFKTDRIIKTNGTILLRIKLCNYKLNCTWYGLQRCRFLSYVYEVGVCNGKMIAWRCEI